MTKSNICSKCSTNFDKKMTECPECGEKVKMGIFKKIMIVWIALAIVSLVYRTANDDPENEKLVNAIEESITDNQ